MKKRHFVGILCLAVLGYVLYLATIAGEFKSLEPHFDGQCQLISGPMGAEDIVILADGRGAFISSNDRRADLRGESANGAIFYYDLSQPDAVPIDVTPALKTTFRPHGIALNEGSPTTLFVVNHPGADVLGNIDGDGPVHTIEVFDVVGSKMTHRKTIADEEALISPNDVAPISASQFYVTNDHGSRNKLVRMAEDYFRIARAHVLFYDGEKFSRMPGEYHYANGIIASADGAEVYLASPVDNKIFLFDRDAETNDLALRRELAVGTGVDNINVDSNGDLWLGAHPKLLTFTTHMMGMRETAPSQVVRLNRGAGYSAEEVLLSDGNDLAGSSTAARHGNRLLVGGVFAAGFLDCTMAPASK